MNPTKRCGLWIPLCLALLAVATNPRPAASSTIALSSALANGTFVNSGGSVTTSAENVVSAGDYEARAFTGAANGALTGGVMALTSAEEQRARASAHVESTWNCPSGGCVQPGNLQPNMSVNLSFDGVLDPLIFSNPADETFDTASMDVYFRYVFPGGEFNFSACYEPGTPFIRGELGCGSFYYLTLDRPGENTLDLTNLLQFGPNNTVSFNYTFSWLVQSASWIDSYDIVADIRSIDSTTPHALNFFNTFGVRQTSLNPNAVFTTGSGLSSAPINAEVPEPTSMVLLGSGILLLARKRRALAPRLPIPARLPTPARHPTLDPRLPSP